MTPDQAFQVQKSFVAVERSSGASATMFYRRLFEIAPEVEPLFPSDMTDQKLKLMSMLGLVVIGLDKLDTILPAASSLARRHVGYGVRAEHYRSVGAALLSTLEGQLGPAWTEELARAWEAAYAKLSSHMIDEAYGPARVRPA